MVHSKDKLRTRTRGDYKTKLRIALSPTSWHIALEPAVNHWLLTDWRVTTTHRHNLQPHNALTAVLLTSHCLLTVENYSSKTPRFNAGEPFSAQSTIKPLGRTGWADISRHRSTGDYEDDECSWAWCGQTRRLRAGDLNPQRKEYELAKQFPKPLVLLFTLLISVRAFAKKYDKAINSNFGNRLQ